MLRSHTNVNLPSALEEYAGRSEVDELNVAPGLVYCRDAVDHSHLGEPHQVDVWRIRSTPDTGDEDMLAMIGRGSASRRRVEDDQCCAPLHDWRPANRRPPRGE